MVNRLALAEQFLQEQLQTRSDIIAAWVGGFNRRWRTLTRHRLKSRAYLSLPNVSRAVCSR
jgi:hypothetical protein